MTREEAIQAKQEIEKAFDEISNRMCALRFQYPELGMLAAFRFSQHSIIDNGYDPGNVAATGSTLLGNFETTFTSLIHILHGIAVRENQPNVAEALVTSLANSWENMKKEYNITLE